MSSNMDSDDKNFFMKMFEKIEKHLEKTCDELHEVDKNVIELQSDFRNHLDCTKNNENRKWKIVSAVLAGAVIIVMILQIMP